VSLLVLPSVQLSEATSEQSHRLKPAIGRLSNRQMDATAFPRALTPALHAALADTALITEPRPRVLGKKWPRFTTTNARRAGCGPHQNKLALAEEVTADEGRMCRPTGCIADNAAECG